MNEKQMNRRTRYDREADAVMREALRKMGMDGRARLTFNLSASLRSISMAGVRSRHPEYTDRQVQLGAIKLAIGGKLFKEVYPNEDVEP